MFKKEERLKNQGSYGKVFQAKYNGRKILLKENRELDINLEHEHLISKQLQKTNCKQFFSKSLCFVEKKPSGGAQQLAIEWIDHAGTFFDMIETLSKDVVYNIFQHLCLIILWAQDECKFMHNDLHLNNILLLKTQQKYYQYPKHKLRYMGFKPIIIDFGFSHSVNVDGMKSTLTQTHRGMHPMIFNRYFDFITLRKAVYKNDKNWIQIHFPLLSTRYGFLKMKMSLFDYLTRICGTSTYDRVNDDDDIVDDNFSTVKRKSLRTLYEDNLYFALSNVSLDSSREYKVNLDTLFQQWDGSLPVPQEIEKGLLFHIDLYNKFYSKYIKSVFGNVDISKFIKTILIHT
jgi:serine/threonine protein kinase